MGLKLSACHFSSSPEEACPQPLTNWMVIGWELHLVAGCPKRQLLWRLLQCRAARAVGPLAQTLRQTVPGPAALRATTVWGLAGPNHPLTGELQGPPWRGPSSELVPGQCYDCTQRAGSWPQTQKRSGGQTSVSLVGKWEWHLLPIPGQLRLLRPPRCEARLLRPDQRLGEGPEAVSPGSTLHQPQLGPGDNPFPEALPGRVISQKRRWKSLDTQLPQEKGQLLAQAPDSRTVPPAAGVDSSTGGRVPVPFSGRHRISHGLHKAGLGSHRSWSLLPLE
ncbi:uncharacterized protein LOC118147737 [Callithrix jacchus]